MKKIISLLAIVALCHSTMAQVPSHKDVFSKIVQSNIRFPEVAFAQAILESGHFKSKVARQNNNLFGMRMPKQRKTTAIGTNGGYARYKSWQASVRDYKLWQDNLFKRYPNMTLSQFKSYVDRRYSTSENYIAKINSIIKTNRLKYEIQTVLDDCDSVRNDFSDSVRIFAAN